jgi:hypothetical protein
MIAPATTIHDFKGCATNPICVFCDLIIWKDEWPCLKMQSRTTTLFIHKNCAIAFAAQVQNEFEKIDAAAKISSSDYSQT